MTGPELKQWREALGWTQPRAAAELGVSLRGYQWCEKNGPQSSMAKHAVRIRELLRRYDWG